MSIVTNIMLAMDCGASEELIEIINDLIPQNGFVSVDDEKLPQGWYGGSKYLEVSLFIGAFNYLNLNKLVAAMRLIDYSEYDISFVQLIVCGQHDDGFGIIDVFKSVHAEPFNPSEYKLC